VKYFLKKEKKKKKTEKKEKKRKRKKQKEKRKRKKEKRKEKKKEEKKKRKKEKEKKEKKETKRNKNKRKKRRVSRRAISAGHRVQEHNPSCYKWARRGEESKLPSLLNDPLSACSHGISRKKQLMRACVVRAVVNVRERKHAGVRVYHSE
jgi:outer membrane biosynthesis protein TonB